MTHNHYHNVTVTEKRAPTDESVRLLKELEQAATDRVVGAFELPSNTIRTKVAVSRDPMWGDNLFFILTEINGKRHEMRITIDATKDRRGQFDQLYEEVSKQIAQVIMPDVFDEAFTQGLF